MPKYVGAIDQGTSSTRFIIFDHEGNTVSSAQLEHEQICPQSGLVEHDAEEIWNRVLETSSMALEEAKVDHGGVQLQAVGITNQRESTVVWNKHTGKPYHNVLVWMDTRTKDLCDKLAGEDKIKGKDRFREKTGLPIVPYFAGTKLLWLLENVKGLRKDAEKGDALFGTIDTWILWKLSGGKHHITDVTNASRTLLMDISTLKWDVEQCKLLGIPMQMLPEIRSSSEVYFHATEGSLRGVPISGILGDQHAAMVGQACFDPGEAKNTYGTGCFLLLNTGTKLVQSSHGLLSTVAYKLGPEAPTVYALEGSVAIGGALVQFIRDNFEMITSAPEIEVLAKRVADNGGVYFVPAFSGLYAPHWRDDARGIIAGLTRYSNRNHLARAVLEACAFQSNEVFEAMAKDAGVKLDSLKVDGGMVANETLMQFQADILNAPVIRPRITETTALGAAYAAGLAVKFWKDEAELRSQWKEDKRWQPHMTDEKRKELYHGWNKAVERTLGWVETSRTQPKGRPLTRLPSSQPASQQSTFSKTLSSIHPALSFLAGAALALGVTFLIRR